MKALLTTLFLSLALAASAQAPVERLYVTTDRSVYLAGDAVWCSVANLNENARFSNASAVSYLELVSGGGTVCTVKIGLLEGRGAGSFRIPVTVPTGTYRLIAYTAVNAAESGKPWEAGSRLLTIFNSTTDARVPGGVEIMEEKDYEACVEFRYSPGSRVFIDRMGIESPFALEKDAPTIKLTHYVGFLDDRHNGGDGFIYNRTEAMFDKRFWFSAFGHLDLRVQTGMIWQKVPFTKLVIPQASTSIFLAQRAFNLMKPMEFLMDAYVALFATYYFKGWILNRIPGINKLKLRGVVSVAAIYGGLTKKNNPYLETGTGLYEFPQDATFDNNGYWTAGRTSSPIGKLPYIEITAGFENILKFIRIDYVRRILYNDYALPYTVPVPGVDEEGNPTTIMVPARRRIPAWGRNGVKITFRIAL